MKWCKKERNERNKIRIKCLRNINKEANLQKEIRENLKEIRNSDNGEERSTETKKYVNESQIGLKIMKMSKQEIK